MPHRVPDDLVTATLGEIVWCPACRSAVPVEVESTEIMVMEREKPVKVILTPVCGGCGCTLL